MESVLKRYFPVIIKPFFLILLLFAAVSLSFVIFRVVSPLRPEQTIISPHFSPETREMLRELFALDKPLSIQYMKHIQNMFTWNFGYSFRTMAPVAEEMSWRLPTTILLIGVSTAFSVLIGVALSVVMGILFKPSRRRPSTFAHSLRGFFLGPVPFLALLFVFFFSYYAYFTWGFKIFPSSSMYSMPPPADPLAYIVDVAWHLAQPVTVLVVVNMVRVVLTVWSSGSPFTTKKMLKSALLPITTTDFTFTISAVIIVEWIFSLPGIGRWFLSSLLTADFPVIMASSVVFVEIAVGLGFFSVLFDFVERFAGLRDDLDKKIPTESLISSNQTGVHKKPVKHVLRRKSVILGSAIVIVFLVLAIFAPFITPYDPVIRRRVAEDFAAPGWMTVFPQFEDYPTTQDYMLYWNVEEGSEFIISWGEVVAVEYEAKTMETFDVELSSKFSYTEIPPNSFHFKLDWNASDVESTEYSLRITLLTPEGENRTSWLLWSKSGLKTISGERTYVESVSPFFRAMLGFEMEENPAPVILGEKGEYTLLLKMQFKPDSDTARCDIEFQNSQFVIPGRVHGVLGCDDTGSDLFTQLVYGARTALILASFAAFLAIMLGFPFGFLSGYFQGWADNVIMPLTDTLLCLPILPIFLAVVFLFGKSWITFPLMSLLFLSPLAAKAFRNMFMVRPSDQKFKGETGAEKALNTFKDLLLNVCLTAISFVLLLPTIDFLGFGDPRVVSWGKMLHHAYGFGAFTRLAWWWILPPIIFIGLLALGFLLLGAGLEDT